MVYPTFTRGIENSERRTRVGTAEPGDQRKEPGIFQNYFTHPQRSILQPLEVFSSLQKMFLPAFLELKRILRERHNYTKVSRTQAFTIIYIPTRKSQKQSLAYITDRAKVILLQSIKPMHAYTRKYILHEH